MSTTTPTSLPTSFPFPAPLIVPSRASKLPAIDQGSVLVADSKINVPQEIVCGLLHAGTKGVIASGSKARKTWVLLDLATSIASGTPLLKWETTAGKVLFINFEISRPFFKNRLQTIQESKHLPHLDNLNVWTLRGRSEDVDTVLEAIVERIKEDRYALIILDPVYKLMVGRNENGTSGVGWLCHQLERLAEKTGAAVVYAHHFTKGNASKKKAMDRMSGSGLFARDADTIMTLTEHAEKDCYALEMTLRNFPPQPAIVVEWDFPLMVERADLDPTELKQNESEPEDDMEPLLELLDDKPLTTAEWQEAAKAVGYSRATFYRLRQKPDFTKKLKFDRKDKTWARQTIETDAGEVGSSAGQTGETAETSETGQPNPAEPPADPKGEDCQAAALAPTPTP